MVAVISGGGLGLFGSSASVLGGVHGNASLGRGTDRLYINSATGNLIVQSVDESLAALGLDVSLVRTYNSQGLMDDDNGDNWRLGIHQRLHGCWRVCLAMRWGAASLRALRGAQTTLRECNGSRNRRDRRAGATTRS